MKTETNIHMIAPEMQMPRVCRIAVVERKIQCIPLEKTNAPRIVVLRAARSMQPKGPARADVVALRRTKVGLIMRSLFFD